MGAKVLGDYSKGKEARARGALKTTGGRMAAGVKCYTEYYSLSLYDGTDQMGA
jgi:hypothetical protein